MNDLKIFNSPEFGQIRTVEIEGKIYFVASDMARALGYAKPANAVAMHCRYTLKQGIGVQTGIKADGTPAFQTIEMLIIPEGDMYRLIAHSKLPSAERFESWVFDEVLPSIRQNGYYENPNMSTEMKAILMIDEKQVKMEKRIERLEFDIPLYGSEADELSGHVKRKGTSILGGKKSNAYRDSVLRSKVYRDIYEQLKREFGIYDDTGHPKSFKALKRKYLADAHELIDCYSAPTYLVEMIEASNAQMNLNIA